MATIEGLAARCVSLTDAAGPVQAHALDCPSSPKRGSCDRMPTLPLAGTAIPLSLSR